MKKKMTKALEGPSSFEQTITAEEWKRREQDPPRPVHFVRHQPGSET